MKNIHILPTDKPSRLFTNNYGEYKLHNDLSKLPLDSIGSNQNIYITSDEEIKEGDWVIQVNFEKTNTQLIQCATEFQVKIANDKDGSFTKKKIILTTDQDLIKDGVQAISKAFLEWFVKNPSCEWVEVGYGVIRLTENDNEGYWISIPDVEFNMQIEEPKEKLSKDEIDKFFIDMVLNPKEEPKQETLEEAVSEFKKTDVYINEIKQQQEQQMYSEEEVIDFLQKMNDWPTTFEGKIDIREWFEQFKKK